MGNINCLVTPILQNTFYFQQKKETHSTLKPFSFWEGTIPLMLVKQQKAKRTLLTALD